MGGVGCCHNLQVPSFGRSGSLTFFFGCFLVVLNTRSVNGGFQRGVRVLLGNEISLTQLILFLPLLSLNATPAQPAISRTTLWKPRFTSPWFIHFQLHFSAKIESVIEMVNPLFRRSPTCCYGLLGFSAAAWPERQHAAQPPRHNCRAMLS